MDNTAPRFYLFRLVFVLAGAFNVALGAVGLLWPGSLFSIFDVPTPANLAPWQAFAVIVGLTGLLYAYASLRLERARPIIAGGLGAKVLVAIAFAVAVATGRLPSRILPLVMLGAVIWWLPFSLFLLDRTGAGAALRRAAPQICAGLNAIAALALLLVLRPGTEAEADLATRIAYITDNAVAWRIGWSAWVAAAMSLMLFYAWWAARLGARRGVVLALEVGACGLAFDLTAESLLIGWLPRDYFTVAPIATFLTGVAGNGFYTLAGMVLTLATPGLSRGFRAWTWSIWLVGLALSYFTFDTNFTMVGVTSALLFILFCPWCIALKQRLG